MTGQWVQPGLFGDTAGPVRPTDPTTSREAAGIGGRANQRHRVLVALLTYGPAHDERVAELLQIDKGSAAKRRGELRDLGLVEFDGSYAVTSHGARTQRWRLTMAGREAAVEARNQ